MSKWFWVFANRLTFLFPLGTPFFLTAFVLMIGDSGDSGSCLRCLCAGAFAGVLGESSGRFAVRGNIWFGLGWKVVHAFM